MRIVKQGLWEAVNTKGGTARGIRLKKYPISGKTGTAQVVARKDPEPGKKEEEQEIAEEHKDHAWFVAYAPSEAPQIAVSVIVEHGEHGSTAAAPVAQEIIKAYLEKAEQGKLMADVAEGLKNRTSNIE